MTSYRFHPDALLDYENATRFEPSGPECALIANSNRKGEAGHVLCFERAYTLREFYMDEPPTKGVLRFATEAC